jgi:hypothetical protein
MDNSVGWRRPEAPKAPGSKNCAIKLDIKEPTALQSAGQRYGEFIAGREEAKRAVRPRGPIEYLGRRATAPLEARP